jgi:DnaK suppressor protein
MNKELLSQFKKELEEKRKNLLEKIENLGKVPDFGSDVDSGEEEADETEEFGNQLGVAQAYREDLADVETALDKIREGRYGICENCGEEISSNVLKLSPESKLCKNCKRLS